MSLDIIIKKVFGKLRESRFVFENFIELSEAGVFEGYDGPKCMKDVFEEFPELYSLALMFDISSRSERLLVEKREIESRDSFLDSQIKQLNAEIKENKDKIDYYLSKKSKSRGRKELFKKKKSYSELLKEHELKVRELEKTLAEVKDQRIKTQESFSDFADKVEDFGVYVNNFLSLKKGIDDDLENVILDYCFSLSEELGFDISASESASYLEIPKYVSQKVFDLLKSRFGRTDVVQNFKPKKPKTVKDVDFSKRNAVVVPEQRPIINERDVYKGLEKFYKFLIAAGIVFISGSLFFYFKSDKNHSYVNPGPSVYVVKNFKENIDKLKKLTEDFFRLSSAVDEFAKDLNEISKKEIEIKFAKFFIRHHLFEELSIKDGVAYSESFSNFINTPKGQYRLLDYNDLTKELRSIKLQGGSILSYSLDNLSKRVFDDVPDFFFNPDNVLRQAQPVDIDTVKGKARLLMPVSGFVVEGRLNKELIWEFNSHLKDFELSYVLGGKTFFPKTSEIKAYFQEFPEDLQLIVELPNSNFKYVKTYKFEDFLKK